MNPSTNSANSAMTVEIPIPTVDAFAESVTHIAQRLGETQSVPLELIRRIAQHIGVEAAQRFMQEAQRVEQQGGLLRASGKDRRTLGGVFFKLVKESVSADTRKIIWKRFGPRKRKKQSVSVAPPFVWEERANLVFIQDSLKKPGEAITVKITLVGRPSRIIQKDSCVITTMQNGKAPTLPKGLPTPPSTPTNYIVYIALKQWKTLEESLKDPNDLLIIEGYATFDAQLKAMAVFAQNATSKLIQAAKREAQKAPDDNVVTKPVAESPRPATKK
jgi:hypothetical protein